MSSEEIWSKQEKDLQTCGKFSGTVYVPNGNRSRGKHAFDEERFYGFGTRTANSSLRLFWSDKIVSRGICPPRSADLNTCEFFFMGNVEG